MAYPCPHCSQPVRRCGSEGVLWHHGVTAMLFCWALADFECPRCGKILQEEFPPEVRSQMSRGSYGLVAVGAGVAAAAAALGLFCAILRHVV
jgi:hypothetical protein